MRLTITMDLDNAAFEDGGGQEITRILTDLCRKLPDEICEGNRALFDINGNRVGTAEIVQG